MIRGFFVFALLIALGLASQANAQFKPAPLKQIFETYNDCFAATPSGGISTAELEKLGWGRASIQGGKPGANDKIIIYGHSDRNPIIFLSAISGSGMCIVTARLKKKSDFTKFLSAFGSKLPEADKDGNITFMAEGRTVQIARTGSSKKPSMRAVVMTPMEKK